MPSLLRVSSILRGEAEGDGAKEDGADLTFVYVSL